MSRSLSSYRRSPPRTQDWPLTPVKLDDLSFDHLNHTLGIRGYQVYGASDENAPLVPVVEAHNAARNGHAPPSNSMEIDGKLAFKDVPLRQTLIICPSQDLRTTPKSLPGLLPAQADVRDMFQKNAEGTPLQIHGAGYNPWEFDDYVFHMPFFTELAEKHTATDKPPGSICCVRPAADQPDAAAASRWSLLSLLGRSQNAAPVNELETPHRGFCFVRKAVTICVSDNGDPYANNIDEDHPHKNAQNRGTKWTALVIDPDSFLQRALAADADGHFLRGVLPASARNPNKTPRLRWEENQTADFVQTRLIGVALKSVSDGWQQTIEAVEDECAAFERAVREQMGKPAYWRGGVNATLVEAHKLARGLGVLEQSIKDAIGDPEAPATEIGVWKKFRGARPRKRMWRLGKAWGDDGCGGTGTGKGDKRRDGGCGGTGTGKGDKRRDGGGGGTGPWKGDKRMEKEMRRLRHLLWDVCDVYGHRLFTAQARLRAKREGMDGLRELLIDLSQTRASLYANQLGDHVKYLTYVSIIFLPLSFCVALWSMNYDLHTKDAFIITICLTSMGAVVFLGLLMAYHHEISVNH